jgi:microcystin-dependent protein
LQSKISDSISTASSTAIASSTAVKCAYDIASCALPKAGGTMTGNVLMRTSGNLVPSCVVFCDYLGSCTISGITSSCICDSTTLAASALALCEVYATAGSALPKAGGAVTGTICFTGVTGTGCLQGITDLWQPVTGYCCSNWALSTCGARTLYCCVIGSSLQTTGGTISGGVTFEAGSAGICFLGSTSRLVGVTDSFTTTCATLAASATAVKCAYNVAVAAVPGSCYSSKGGLVVGTGISTYTPLAVGTNGQVLVADSACPNGMKWGTGGGSGTVTSITAGTGLTGGTITTSGTVALDTACVVQPTAYTAKGTILSASAASTPTALAVGGNGCTLVANSACTTGLCWGPGAIPCSTITAKGDLIAGTDPGTSSALPVGANGLFLTANSASATGLCWAQVGDSPVGAIAFFAMNTAPTGWLIADGSCVSRATYSGLFAAVGTTYGAGDGSTTFQLPNLRGRFLRGWNSTATGCDPSRAFGSCQAQALCCHNHGITMCPGTAGVPEWAIKDDTSLTRGYPSCGGSATPSNKQRGFSDCVGGSATETRPDNIALLPCIKVGISVALDVNAHRQLPVRLPVARTTCATTRCSVAVRAPEFRQLLAL